MSSSTSGTERTLPDFGGFSAVDLGEAGESPAVAVEHAAALEQLAHDVAARIASPSGRRRPRV
jgi:hypothetical protein